MKYHTKNGLLQIGLLALIPSCILYTVPGIPNSITEYFRYLLTIFVIGYPLVLNQLRVKRMQSFASLFVVVVIVSAIPSSKGSSSMVPLRNSTLS